MDAPALRIGAPGKQEGVGPPPHGRALVERWGLGPNTEPCAGCDGYGGATL